ncbi:transport permease protein [Vibrio sp. MACH09]|uniref:ABC transporter permease n=1 Tax=unclassified Vibrio TaxID=2614977 RepID=UPI00149330FD|nr:MULTISPECIES: ABC transporter permease [unclassified Vibrio]NOI67926.1 ABC transporter permease [Vibrio sp. 99-8-1]GLO61086.1 transport permease protein [Vibrio sp. MACH09]
MLNGVIGIYYRECTVLRKKIIRIVMAGAVPPFLYLMAFGYGVGKDTTVDGVSYLTFLLPGLLAMSSMNQSYNIATEINISRFYLKIFEEYMLAPNQRWQIIIGEVLYGITKGLIPVGIIAIYSLFCGVSLHFSVQFLVAITLHLTAFSLIGFIVALKMKNHRDQATMNAFIITPMMFLSGTFFPVDQMPSVIQLLASLSPLTYSAELIRAALLDNGNFALSALAILASLNGVLMLLANHIVQRVEV